MTDYEISILNFLNSYRRDLSKSGIFSFTAQILDGTVYVDCQASDSFFIESITYEDGCRVRKSSTYSLVEAVAQLSDLRIDLSTAHEIKIKNLTLAQIKEACKNQKANVGTCRGCLAWEFCRAETSYVNPSDWKIDSTDTITLPCKLPAFDGKMIQVVYRDSYGYVRIRTYSPDEEDDADSFLAEQQQEIEG